MNSVDLLILQLTPFCNIDCKYCYLKDRLDTSKMSIDVVKEAISKVLSESMVGERLSIVWHAGEPLTCKIEHFEYLLEEIQKLTGDKSIKLVHSIQTNGTLINDAWCDLIEKYNIQIGISIDGPEWLNDKNRLTRSGKGTFESVIKGIQKLKNRGIQYHGIAVLTDESLQSPEEIFSFFSDFDFYHLGLNIEEIEGVNESSSLSIDVENRLRKFYTDLFRLYKESNGSLRIREFDQSISAILREPKTLDITELQINTHQTTPLGIVSIDVKGNMSTFSPELLGQNGGKYGSFSFGNILNDSINSIVNNDSFKKVNTDIQRGIEKCKSTCEFFNVCGGGAPSNKLYENGSFDSSETLYCKFTIQLPTEIVLNDLEETFHTRKKVQQL